MTIKVINEKDWTFVKSNNIPRVGDTLMGLEVTNVVWSDDLSEVAVHVGKLLFWVTIDTPEGRFEAGLDAMPVVGDYVDIPDRYLVEKCVISEQETVCFAKRVL